MEATLSGATYSFGSNPTYHDNGGSGFSDQLHTAIGADTSLAGMTPMPYPQIFLTLVLMQP